MRARINSLMVLAASLLAVSPVLAQSDGSFTVGAGSWYQTKPEAKFNEYRDLPRGAFLANYMLREFNGKWAAAAWGDTPTRYDQTNSLYIAHGIDWRLDANFTASPHHFGNQARSPWTRTGNGVFTLPDSLQKAVQNALQNTANPNQNKMLSDLLANAPGVTLAVQTDVTKVRLRGRPIKEWQFEVKGTDRVRTGTQAYGTPFGFTAIELPIPIDQHTVDVDAAATYMHGPARVMVSAGMSSFHNGVQAIRFDNFKVFNTTYSTRTAIGQQATAPDNDLARLRVVGSVQLPHASTFTATLGVSQTNQNQDFLPMTVNPVIRGISGDSLLLERKGLDGKVSDIVQDYRLTGRPLAGLYGTLRFRQEKMDDKTGAIGLPYGFVNYDQAWSRSAVETEAASTTRTIAGFDGDYSLMKQLDLAVLAEHRSRELPDWREVTKDAENVFGVKLRARPLDGTEASFGYQMGQRRMDSFDVAAYDGAEWPSFRRYDVADRDQSKIEGAVSWSANPKLDLSVNGWLGKDDYPNSAYGLSSVDNKQVFGEGTLHMSKTLDVSGGFGYGQQTSKQASIENGTSVISDTTARSPWTADLQDKNVYAFSRVEWWARPKTLQIAADYTFIRDMQTYDFANTQIASISGILPTATATDLAPAFYRTNDVAVTATWHYSALADLGCTYGYTQFDVHDLLAQNVPFVNVNPTAPGTAATGIFLGNAKLNYTAHRFRVTATRRF